MPVTIKPTENLAREAFCSGITDPYELLKASCLDERRKCKRIMYSSFKEANLKDVSGSDNGFVYACIYAYNNHHHLTIRPEDVWFAILSQLGFYVNGNAEKLRSIFVSHQGKKELIVTANSVDTLDPVTITQQFMNEMAKHMNDPDLPEWIKPDFSTTTPDDVTVACILMMGGMQQYFSYTVECCGLPSVTLLGNKSDWQRIFDKIDRVVGISEQAATFHSLLKPVLGYFVRSFDEPENTEVISFWNRIVHYKDAGSGPTYLSGWMTAFCFWDFKGELLYRPPIIQAPNDTWVSPSAPGCDLHGTLYHRVDMEKIPAGYMGVPVKVIDDKEYECRMVAGSVGIQCTSSGKPMEIGSPRKHTSNRQTGESDISESVVGLDSMQPLSGWWMFELMDKKEKRNGRPEGSEKGNKKTGVIKNSGQVKTEVEVKIAQRALENIQDTAEKFEEKSIPTVS